MPRGRSATSVHSDTSDMDIDALAETEMGKLQRQFRVMEGDRQSYSIQSQELLRKQRLEMQKLLEEQEELQKKLRASESQARKMSDNQDTQQLRVLLNRRDRIEDELEKERLLQAELEQQIQIAEKNLAKVRKAETSAFSSKKSQIEHIQKATHTLENKLDLALIRFNKQLATNSQLREELDTLRVERIRFQQLHCKLDKELQEIRRDIGQVISMSTAAYEARVEAQTKMTVLNEKAMKDQEQYSSEIKELERVIAHEQRLKEFMSTKCSERTELDETHDINQPHELSEHRKTDFGEDTVETLEEVFQKIQKVTGEDDLEMLVTKFIQVEDRNFALFNYVNEQNTQAEALRDQIKQINKDIERFQVDQLQQEQENKAAINSLEEQLKDAEVQTLEYEAQANEITKILDQIKTEIKSIFSMIDCDHMVVEDLLGSSAEIRDTNIMTCLSLVERKTNELLTLHAYINSKDTKKNYDPKLVAQFLLGQSSEMEKQIPVIQPPVKIDDYKKEELLLLNDDQPLTQEELCQLIINGVLCKEEALNTGGGRESRFTKPSTMSIQREQSLESGL